MVEQNYCDQMTSKSEIHFSNENYIQNSKFYEFGTELLLRTVNVSFSYKSLNRFLFKERTQDLILSNCSISVPKGKIYSLLGSSGCGKTTLLKCILGIEKVKSGSISVFINKTDSDGIKGSNVGYMPQEMALLEELTVEETLRYFGQLHQMHKNQIKEQIEFLIEFLQIPDKKRLISKLSGGQQRRVSLATAIIHYPSLLILDEPTVGVDPLLRHSIWQYLNDLCANKSITIIITTHYIEEARNSHNIGLMRNGSLLVEGNPGRIIDYYKCRNMEEVFLKLCENRRKSLFEEEINSENNNYNRNIYNDNEIKALDQKSTENAIEKKFLLSDRFLDFSHFWPLLYKNWLIIRGNPRSLIFLYLLPSISVSLFALSFGAEPKNITIAIYNEESPAVFTKLLIENLKESHAIKAISYSTYDSALNSLKRGRSWAMVSLPNNYSESLQQRIHDNIYSSNETIEDSNLSIYLDNTSPIISYTIITTILKSLTNLISTLFPNDKSLIQSVTPIVLQEVPYGSSDKISMTEYFAPGILMATIFIAPWPFVLFSITNEKKIKFLARSLISGANSLEVLLSNLALQLIILSTQVSVLMFTTFWAWKIPNSGNLILTAGILYIIGVIGILFAIIISFICVSEGEAFMISFSIIIPLWLVCGVIWPNESMPPLGQQLSHLAPLTYPIDALRCILSKGWGLTHYTVIMAFVSSFVYILMFLIIALFIYKKHISVY